MNMGSLFLRLAEDGPETKFFLNHVFTKPPLFTDGIRVSMFQKFSNFYAPSMRTWRKVDDTRDSWNHEYYLYDNTAPSPRLAIWDEIANVPVSKDDSEDFYDCVRNLYE
jgi:hypothetical protein